MDICWEKCVEKLGNKMDGKIEICIVNCVERFFDINIFIVKWFLEKFKWVFFVGECEMFEGFGWCGCNLFGIMLELGNMM